MKQVFTDLSTIAHLWANKVQFSAKNSSRNFFFENEQIYSYGYHFVIAMHVTNDRGEAGILFTNRGYSNTTSKHISIVRQASSHLTKVYCYNPEYSHHDNFKQWKLQAESVVGNLTKAKKPAKYLSELGAIQGQVNKYANFFSVDIPLDLQAILSIGCKSDYLEYSTKREEFERKEKAKLNRIAKQKHKEAISKWLNFETNRLYTSLGFDFLRYNKDKNRIETTQAVEIPFELGKRFYQSIVSDTLKQGDNVLNYVVNEVSKDLVKIGCHTFEKKYLISFGSKLYNN